MNEGAYECSLSGVRSEPGDYYEKDGLEDIPPGWIKVSFKRRLMNREWIEIQESKRTLIEAAIAQLPPGMPAALAERQKKMIAHQVRAQFAVLEKDLEPYVVYEESAFIAAPEENADLLEAVNDIRKNFGLVELEMYEAESDEESNEDDNEEMTDKEEGAE